MGGVSTRVLLPHVYNMTTPLFRGLGEELEGGGFDDPLFTCLKVFLQRSSSGKVSRLAALLKLDFALLSKKLLQFLGLYFITIKYCTLWLG